MSLIKAIKAQLGLSFNQANNFVLDASADNGTMKLARGNAGATTQDIMLVASDGKVSFPQNPAVSGSGPVFSAWKSAATTLPSGSGTETPYETETTDSANCYNPTTGRFTPNVAGWYLFVATGNPKGDSTSSSGGVQLRKNGTDVFAITLISASLSGSGGTLINVSGLVYLNGSTDYVSVFQYVTGTGALTAASGASSVFSGTLVRGA